mmetsp:Transcript_1289/g.3934  ORF Transcript_1289/g.3934 Transcript_1289/m.3934 type:complete len:277 (+) Transcript_1289:25-855(+)
MSVEDDLFCEEAFLNPDAGGEEDIFGDEKLLEGKSDAEQVVDESSQDVPDDDVTLRFGPHIHGRQSVKAIWEAAIAYAKQLSEKNERGTDADRGKLEIELLTRKELRDGTNLLLQPKTVNMKDRARIARRKRLPRNSCRTQASLEPAGKLSTSHTTSSGLFTFDRSQSASSREEKRRKVDRSNELSADAKTLPRKRQNKKLVLLDRKDHPAVFDSRPEESAEPLLEFDEMPEDVVLPPNTESIELIRDVKLGRDEGYDCFNEDNDAESFANITNGE